MRSVKLRGLIVAAGFLFLCGCGSNGGGGSTQSSAQLLPNMGQQITPLAPQGSRFESLNPDLPGNPKWLAGHAVTTVVSPDKKTLLVLTSGYNRVYVPDTHYVPGSVPDAFGTYFNWAQSTEYVFIYDISTGTPIKKQVVKVPNTYHGIVFDPTGKAFYVSNGMGDFPFDNNGNIITNPADIGTVPGDAVHIVTLNATTGKWVDQPGTALALSHPVGNGLNVDASDGTLLPPNERVAVSPCAAGLSISQDGKTLVVANYFNDSISIFKGGLGHWTRQQPPTPPPSLPPVPDFDLRPGKSGGVSGEPGGEYPFWVSIKGNGSSAKAYVSSIRDREIVVVNVGDSPSIITRIPVKGQPNKMTLNADQSILYVAEDQTDTVDVIDTVKDNIVETIQIIKTASVIPSSLANYTGANTNSVTLSPDEKQLYVTNGNLNCVAVVALTGTNSNDKVIGLIPTGWYPNSVSFSGDGNWVYVVNAKSPTGPNPGFYYSYGPPTHKNGYGTNLYNPQLTKAGLQSFPRPGAEQLASLSSQVAVNNRFSYTVSARDAAVMAAVRSGVQHVIFIIKENRTYDQLLGDLEIGNGDPALAEFGEPLTPNQHNLARRFVILDNFYDTAEVSYDGWAWTTAARATDVVEHQSPVMYAGRGLSLECDGANRSVNVAISGVAARQAADPLTPGDADLLPGNANNDVSDTGYLWDAALRVGLTVRSYGFWVDGTRYSFPQPPAPGATPVKGSEYSIPLLRRPFTDTHTDTGTSITPPTQVAISESVSLTPYTDIYFRGFDNAFPDYWRFKEWEREFDTKYDPAGGGGEDLPALSLVRFMHDHTGSFSTAIDRVNTPELMQADNDYAVGLLIEKISKSSKYKNNTLIFVVEDDAQDGPDHVDSHRSIAFVAGAYVKQHTLVSTQYNTIDYVRTIEEVLGLTPMNINDALARPMADIFNTTPLTWSFTAFPPASLCGTDLASEIPSCSTVMIIPKSTHSAKYWARVTKGMDFSSEDKFNFAVYNHILWKGLMGNKPYPAASTGEDLRINRKEYLANYRQSLK